MNNPRKELPFHLLSTRFLTLTEQTPGRCYSIFSEYDFSRGRAQFGNRNNEVKITSLKGNIYLENKKLLYKKGNINLGNKILYGS